jgi:hypothetical protein
MDGDLPRLVLRRSPDLDLLESVSDAHIGRRGRAAPGDADRHQRRQQGS